MSDQEESSGIPDKLSFWRRIGSEMELSGQDVWDPDYVRELDEEIERRSKPAYAGQPTPKLFDGIRYLKNVHHLSVKSIIKKLAEHGVKKEIVLKAYEVIKKQDTEDRRQEVERLIYKNPLVVPPGLNSAVMHFESHFAVSGDEPVMISGPTGVGKSLFLYLAKRLFQKQHENEELVPPVIEANCGHFAGKSSDLNIVRSELFGLAERAVTGIIREKKGLVESANGGLLILEEVGELPFEAQAMLLTFIETGDYRRLGDEETRKSKVKIVAATNRESDLRTDFRYRFFPYYIPPIQARRGDVLYYFNEIFPELTKSFTRSEVLLLLSHNWPGSVREIERIGRLLIRNKSIVGRAASNEGQGSENNDRNVKISHLDPRDTAFDPGIIGKLCIKLESWDVDLALVERLLNKHRISLNEDNDEPAFPELAQGDGYFTGFDEFALKYCQEFQPFEEAYEGYLRFCNLFLQDPAKEANVLATLRDCISPFDVPTRLKYPDSYKAQIDKLIRAIMKYLKGVRKPDSQLPRNPYHAWKALEEIGSDDDGNAKGSGLSAFALDEISRLKEEDLLKKYYSKLLKTCSGNVRAAAMKTGLEENTFRSRLYKLGLKTKKQ